MIFADALPKIKAFLKPAQLTAATLGLLARLLAAFLARSGRMSCSQAADAFRSQRRHRAQLVRFLARRHWSRDWTLLHDVAGLLLHEESRSEGTWVLILDQTYVGQQGQKTENTFSRANYRPRQKKSQRKQKKGAKRSCHGFVMGLLLTPSGLRLPCCRCYYAAGHCQAKGLPYRTQTELAAELIRTVAVPAGADVVVVGDTAFEAQVIRQACQQRQFVWVVPLNPERVLAGPKPRVKVKALLAAWSAAPFQVVTLVPGQGVHAAQRRVAQCRLGRNIKSRTYYVHQERRAVHNVGEVRLVFSSKEQPHAGWEGAEPKILMSNDLTRSVAAVVELYDLRWQIELFFKELKSTLGFAQYRFRQFGKVEGWTQACLVTFCYLEWWRARQLARRDLSEPERRWWGWQRSHGVAQALRREAEERDLGRLLRWSGSRTGLQRLRRSLRAVLAARRPEKPQRKQAG